MIFKPILKKAASKCYFGSDIVIIIRALSGRLAGLHRAEGLAEEDSLSFIKGHFIYMFLRYKVYVPFCTQKCSNFLPE